MDALAVEVATSTPDELAALIPAEIAKWAQVVRDAGITPYLALWMGKFNDVETTTAVNAWNADKVVRKVSSAPAASPACTCASPRRVEV